MGIASAFARWATVDGVAPPTLGAGFISAFGGVANMGGFAGRPRSQITDSGSRRRPIPKNFFLVRIAHY